MDLRDYLRILTRRWRLILACTLLALAAATAATFAATPIYQAESELFVSADSSRADISQLNQGNLFTQQRVKSYADVINSPLVLRPVIERLGLKTSTERLAQKVTAEAPLDTVLINVSVRDSSARRAADIANAVSEQFTTVVSSLERPQGGASDASPVKVSVVRAAQAPTGPVSPRPTVNLALGLMVGLALGVGLAVLRESLDTSVKRGEDLDLVGSPAMLGVIGYDGEAAKHPVILAADAHGLRGEAFRQLRTNLQFIDVDRPPRSIVVTSSVSGEGKTTTACNLAVTLAHAGHTVVLVEADLRRPRIPTYLGLEGAAGLTTVLIGQADIDDVLQPVGDGRLIVLAGGPTPPNPSELLGSNQMRELVDALRERADYVVIDAPPLLPVTDAAVVSKVADGALVVVRAGKTRREQLDRAVALLRRVDARVLGVVLNMVPTKGRDAYTYGYEYRPAPVAASANGSARWHTGATANGSAAGVGEGMTRVGARRRKPTKVG